jgi:hypothetical protein
MALTREDFDAGKVKALVDAALAESDPDKREALRKAARAEFDRQIDAQIAADLKRPA